MHFILTTLLIAIVGVAARFDKAHDELLVDGQPHQSLLLPGTSVECVARAHLHSVCPHAYRLVYVVQLALQPLWLLVTPCGGRVTWTLTALLPATSSGIPTNIHCVHNMFRSIGA
jgi:hypothetical protein